MFETLVRNDNNNDVIDRRNFGMAINFVAFECIAMISFDTPVVNYLYFSYICKCYALVNRVI